MHDRFPQLFRVFIRPVSNEEERPQDQPEA
jgi:hypothetical protein